MNDPDLQIEKITFVLNDETVESVFHAAYPLLDFIRKDKKLSGTKEVCKEGDCGACTVLIGELEGDHILYRSINSCLVPIGRAEGRHIVTIEGLKNSEPGIIQRAFVEEGGIQCGFCTPGFIVSITGYLLTEIEYSYETLLHFIDGNICRCTGYTGIIRAVKNILRQLKGIEGKNKIDFLIENNVVPEYFASIPFELERIARVAVKKELRPGFVSVSGGTDLMVQQPDELLNKNVRVLTRNSSVDRVEIEGGNFVMDARITVTGIQESEAIRDHFPELSPALDLFGSRQIRNIATAGGNIVNASPIADLVNILLVLDTELLITSEAGYRSVNLGDFYLDYKKVDLGKNERIDKIKFKAPLGNYYFNFAKVSKRTYLDIASVNSSVLLQLEGDKIVDAIISAGGVAPVPLLLRKTSDYLINSRITNELVLRAAETATGEIQPISDARGSAEYKSALLYRIILNHFIGKFETIHTDILL